MKSFSFSDSATKPSRSAGFTLLEMLGVLVLIGLLSTALAIKIPGILDRGRDSKAVTIHDDLQGWYSSWVTAGGVHNATTSNEGQMAYFLLGVMSGDPSDTGLSKTPDGDGNWVDETRLMSGMGADRKSVPGALRQQIMKPYVMDSATNTVLFDSQWDITFHPKSNSSGEFAVTVRRD